MSFVVIAHDEFTAEVARVTAGNNMPDVPLSVAGTLAEFVFVCFHLWLIPYQAEIYLRSF